MKSFLQTFFIILSVGFIFIFLGGYILFDFSRHFYLALTFSSLLIALLITVLYNQSEKIEKLEERIKALEETKGDH